MFSKETLCPNFDQPCPLSFEPQAAFAHCSKIPGYATGYDDGMSRDYVYISILFSMQLMPLLFL